VLFEVITRRYQLRRPTVLTTNRAFSEWNQVFPNATCVVALIDRLGARPSNGFDTLASRVSGVKKHGEDLS
jgi:hypothetical protein